MRLMNDYKNMGGRVTVGSDPGFIYQTWGFSYIQELEMLQEAGFAPLEVVQAATINGARELYAPRGEEPPIRPIWLLRSSYRSSIFVVIAPICIPHERSMGLTGSGRSRHRRTAATPWRGSSTTASRSSR